MDNKGLTTMSVRKINRNKVYNYIYQKQSTFKLQIVQDLQMGLSTVSQNLKLLEEEGLIERNGFFDSTGGRKAQAIQIVRTAGISIGIGILRKMIHIAAIDLYGDFVFKETIDFPYIPEAAYYKQLNCYLEEFITKNNLPKDKILGVSIATQGIISSDGESVNYGVLMDNINMKLANFQEYISYPCRLEHDSKAAAYLEAWNHKEISNAAVVILNRNLGGALIINGIVHHGDHMRSGIIEHLCINNGGPLCYCGNRGCLETYCSANALESASEMSIPDFFHKLRNEKGSSTLSQIWDDYLNHLAFAIHNLNIILDSSVIISGYLAPYFTEEDVVYLLSQINQSNPFPLKREQLILGTHGQYTPAAGAALHYVKKFLGQV